MKTHCFIETASASKYLQQLCKHWGHKFEVDFTADAGSIQFPNGALCELKAETGGLNIFLSCSNEDRAKRLQGTVLEHLQRFAFRETLPVAEWHPSA